MILHPTDPNAVAAAVAAYGLGGAGRASIPSHPETWGTLARVLETDRLSGIALAASDERNLAMPRAARERLAAIHADEMMWALGLERRLGQVLDALTRAGVTAMLLKGPVMAHLRYPDPAWRPFADLDLLVRGSDRTRASHALADAGYAPSRPSPRPGFDDRFGKAVVHRGPTGVEIDLHRTLAQGPYVAWIDADRLWERAVPFEVAGVKTLRLDDTALLLHACVHASLGGREPNLLILRDVAASWDAPGVDWDALAALARAWRLGSVIRRAFGLTEARLGVVPPPEAHIVWTIGSDRRELNALRSYTAPRGAGAGADVALLAALPGVSARARYAFSLLFPSRAFMQARARSGGGAPTYRHRLTEAAHRLGHEGRV